MYDNIGKKKPTTKDLQTTILNEMPQINVMRKIINPNDTTGLDIVLFQFQTCPFCCKVRAFLDYAGLSYSVVEVDAVLRQSIKWSASKKVPIVLIRSKNGQYVQLNDSSMIISAITSILIDPAKNDIKDVANYYPVSTFSDVYGTLHDIGNKYFLMFQDKKPTESKETFDEERQWRSWADNHLVHLISPNVYRTYDEALETFKWFSQTGQWNTYFPSWEVNLMVHVGTFAMWLISKRLKKKHHLGDDVRVHLYDACDNWMKALEKKQTKFFGGNKTPNLADLAVFGVLSSMEGCEAFKDCLENTRIGQWFYEVKALVDSNRGHRKPLSLYSI
jgi:microsomal prostaglandin-E synthase 2